MERICRSTRNYNTDSPDVYLVQDLRKDLNTASDGKILRKPFRYLIKMDYELFSSLERSMGQRPDTFMGVEVRISSTLKGEYVILKQNNVDFPDLNSWWKSLLLEEKIKLYSMRGGDK